MALEIGLALIGAGLVCYILEAMNPGFFIAVPGTVLLVAGALLVFVPDLFDVPYVWAIIILVAAGSAWATMHAYRRWAPPEKSRTTSSVDTIVGKTGVAADAVTPDGGRVRIEGEAWRAVSAGPIAPGSRVEVVGLEGNLTLRVKAIESPTNPTNPPM